MRSLQYDPHLMEWLRLAGIIVVTLAALLALIAMVLMSETPQGAPLILSGG